MLNINCMSTGSGTLHRMNAYTHNVNPKARTSGEHSARQLGMCSYVNYSKQIVEKSKNICLGGQIFVHGVQ